jgi:phage-related protein
VDEKPRRRPLFWEGSSKRDFKRFPIAVQKDMGVALFVVQLGGTPPPAKPWKGLGPGVFELIEDHRGETYRAVYGEDRRKHLRTACVPEEIKIRGQNTYKGD